MIGVVAVIAGLVSFVRFGKIELSRLAGKIYFYFTLVSAATAMGLLKHGFNPGHILSLIIIFLVGIAYFLHGKKAHGKTARHWENFCFSFSFFLSMLPTVNETLTRIPVGHPIASSPKDPIVGSTLLAVLVLFVCGSVYQFIRQRKINRTLA